MRRAAIDVGSNSVLLLVSEEKEGRWIPIAEDSEVTALGEGTKQTGVLSDEAIARTLKAIKRFAEHAHSLGVEDMRIAATMAARIATNRKAFLEKAHAQGTPVFILTGEQEAQLGFEAVVQDPMFNGHDRISIIDPGGHSTELVTADRTGQSWNILFKKSFAVGTLSLKSTTFPDERSEGLQILRGSASIDEVIGLCYRQNACGAVIALGAAGTNLISIRDRLATWMPDKVHGSELQYEEISKYVGSLMPMNDQERASIIGMEKGREKTIHLGALVLERFLFALRAESCFVSIRGWRHALLEKASLDLI